MTDVATLLARDDGLRSVNAGIPSNEGYELSLQRDRMVEGEENR